MAKQMRITIRQDGLLIVRGHSSRLAWCPGCQAEGEMIALDRAAVITGTSPARTEGWLDSPSLHRLQAVDGSPLICLKSLLGCVMNKKTS